MKIMQDKRGKYVAFDVTEFLRWSSKHTAAEKVGQTMDKICEATENGDESYLDTLPFLLTAEEAATSHGIEAPAL
jgi:hypothetical protein